MALVNIRPTTALPVIVGAELPVDIIAYPFCPPVPPEYLVVPPLGAFAAESCPEIFCPPPLPPAPALVPPAPPSPPSMESTASSPALPLLVAPPSDAPPKPLGRPAPPPPPPPLAVLYSDDFLPV